MEDKTHELLQRYELTEAGPARSPSPLFRLVAVGGLHCAPMQAMPPGHICAGLVDITGAPQTVSELYIMYATLQHLPCTEEEEHEFAVESAKANAKHRRAVSELEAARKELEDAERGIQLSVARCLPAIPLPWLGLECNPRGHAKGREGVPRTPLQTGTGASSLGC